MSLKAALHQYLAGKSSVTSLVPAARIVRGKRPVGTVLPCIAFTRVSELDEDHQDGSAQLAQARLQLDIWGTSDSQVEAIRSALRNVLHGLANMSIGTGNDATIISSGVVENSTDDVEWPEDAADPFRFSCSLDWVVWYQSTNPTFS